MKLCLKALVFCVSSAALLHLPGATGVTEDTGADENIEDTGDTDPRTRFCLRLRELLQRRLKRDLQHGPQTGPQSGPQTGPKENLNQKLVLIKQWKSWSGCKLSTCSQHNLLYLLQIMNEHSQKVTAPPKQIGPGGYGRRRRTPLRDLQMEGCSQEE